jgi:anaerobic selenocysteine-containing dehydrogenase
MGDAYPYPIKALFSYMGTPVYALPAGHTNIEILADVNKIPLYFTTDILIGTTTMYADYIFPDLTYLERWEMQGSHPNMPVKVQPVRQPVIAPLVDTVTVLARRCHVLMKRCSLRLRRARNEGLQQDGFARAGFH